MAENVMYALMLKILTGAELNLTTRVGRAVVAPGQQVAWDDCCDGQIAIRHVNTAVFSDTRAVGCKTQSYTHTLALSVIRCAAVLNDQGQAPSTQQINADGWQMTQDFTELQHFLECHPDVATLNTWQPLGVQGGCHGGEWIFTVKQLPLMCCDQLVYPEFSGA